MVRTVGSMNTLQAVDVVRCAFGNARSASIPKLRGGHFSAKLADDGIYVDDLGPQPFLPWAVFEEAVCLLLRKDGRAKRGEAMSAQLGDEKLPVDSVEGHIARVVYGKQPGDWVFRRITPVACILIWAGVCIAAPGELVLRHAPTTG